MMNTGEEGPPPPPPPPYDYDDDDDDDIEDFGVDDYIDEELTDNSLPYDDDESETDDRIVSRTSGTQHRLEPRQRQHVVVVTERAAYERARMLRARQQRCQNNGEQHPRLPRGNKTSILSLFRHVTEIKQDLDFAMDYYDNCVAGWDDNDDDDNDEYAMLDEHYAEFTAAHHRQQQRWPVVTVTLMTVLVAMFIYEMSCNENSWSFERFADNPFLGPSPATLLALGAIYTPDLIVDRSYYRFYAATFLHGGLFHLAVHLPLLYIIGGALERPGHHHHRALLLLVFAGTGFCANVGTATLGEPFAYHTGAAGALCGWYGYCCTDGLLHLHLVTDHRHITILLGIFAELALWFLLGYLLPFLVDNTAHVFGFAAGVLLGLVLIPPRSFRQTSRDCFWQTNRAGLAAAILFCLVSSGLLYLLNAESVVDLPCRDCHRRFLSSCALWPHYHFSYCDPCRVATVITPPVRTTPGGTNGSYYLLHCPYEETVRSQHPILDDDKDSVVAACRESCALY